jgi:photosystem II stability/assembly factor-like uncharacterized protein
MRKILVISMFIGLCIFANADWESIGPFGGQLRTMAIAPSNENIIYVATNTGPSIIFRSLDNGASWGEVGSIPYYVYSMTVDPIDPDIVYAGSYRSVYKSINGGVNWTSHSVSDGYIVDLAVHPTSTSTVYATGNITVGAITTAGFFKSVNGGANWSSDTLDTLKGSGNCLKLDPSNPSIIYVCGSIVDSNLTKPRIYRSINGGTSFSNIASNIPTGNNISSIDINSTSSNMILVGSFYGDGIYRTTNTGGSWSLVWSGTGLSTIDYAPTTSNIAYAGKDTVIYKLTRKIIASPNSSTVVYTTDALGFHKTTNAGSSWFESNYGINIASIPAISLAPTMPSTIYAENDGVGVHKTTDSGTTWTLLPSFLSCGDICEFAVHNSNPNIVLALEGIG